MPEASVTAASGAASDPGARVLRVPDGAASQRVDRFVADVTGLSRSHVQKLISAGNLTSDGVPLRANSVVGPGTPLRLVVPEPEPLDLTPAPEIDLTVVYEDADLLIVDKPAGIVVHPSPGHSDGTLVNALLAHGGPNAFGGIAGVRRPGIVHRLDRDTSGLLMVARTDAAQHSLMAQLKARRVKKTYQALVHGEVAAAVGRIEAPIGRDPKHRTRMGIVADGRAATTGYRVRERFSRLDAAGAGPRHRPDAPDPRPPRCDRPPDRGRPACTARGPHGRGRRAGGGLDRMFLHSWRLELTSPSTGDLIRAEAPLPDELERVARRAPRRA